MSRYVAAVIACGKTKQAAPAPAQELYTGSLTRKAVELATIRRLPVFILSALHGLVPGSMILEPYEESLQAMPYGKRLAWEKRVHEQVHVLPPGPLLVFCGAQYVAGLKPRFKDVERPCYGMAIGQQLQWLTDALNVERRGAPLETTPWKHTGPRWGTA